MALGVFVFVSMLTGAAGAIGTAVKWFLLGACGLVAYVVPLLCVAAGGIVMMSYKMRAQPGKLALTLLSGLLVVTMMHLLVQSHIAQDAGFVNFITDSYDYAQLTAHGKGVRGAGGAGGALAYPLLVAFGAAGSWIIAAAGLLGCILGLTSLSLRDVGERTAQIAKQTIDASAERAAQMRERREARLQERQTLREAQDEPPVPDPSLLRGRRRRGADFHAEQNEAQPAAAEARPAVVIEGMLPQDDLPEPGQIAPVAPTPGVFPWHEPGAEANEAAEADPEPDLPPWKPAHAAHPRGRSAAGGFVLDAAGQTLAALPQAPYAYPSIELLREAPSRKTSRNPREEMEQNARKLEETLKSFGVEATVTGISRGPAITRYELTPAPGVRVSRIASLADDLALNLAAMGVRIEAPIPGKSAIGIEVPNAEVSVVPLRDVLDTDEFRNAPSRVTCALGKDISGRTIIADLARFPHVLIAGATGSGKSVCINTIITSILYKSTPDEVKLVMIDPKVVELSVYNGIPHLLLPVVTDPKKAASALQWAVTEMTERYQKFADKGVRDLKGYNEKVKNLPPPQDEHAPEENPLPQIVVIIDELADLMMVAPGDVEDAICRLAQLARAAGIYLVIATQRPSVNVITGVIKANIPSRIAFAVSSYIDSRTILDMGGAEKLLGRGDMLFSQSGAGKPVRVQGALVTEGEVEEIVEFVRQGQPPAYDQNIIEHVENTAVKDEEGEEEGEVDELLPQCIELAIDSGQASTSMIQRRFKVGYARAGRLLDAMELRGIVSPAEGSKPRKTLMSREEFHRLYG